MTTSLWLDIICAAILLICMITAYARGFIKTILSFSSLIASVILAKIFADKFAEQVSQNFVEPAVAKVVSKKIEESAANYSGDLNDILQVMGDKAKEVFSDALTSTGETIANQSITAISHMVSVIALFCIFLVVFLLLFKIVIYFADVICKLPVLGSVNRMFGLAFGFLQGVFFVALFCILISLFLLGTSDSSVVQTQDINQTYLMKYFYHNDLIGSYLFINQ